MRKTLRLFIYGWLFALVIFPVLVHAQKSYKVKNSSFLSEKETPSGKKEYVFQFRNINKLDYFYNPDMLMQIRKLEENRDIVHAIPIMENYVSNFGIKNFQKDIHMLWRLGLWYEKQGNEAKANAYFRLVLKHTRNGLDRVKLHYDSITREQSGYWVPLKHYYELVEYRKAIDTLRPPEGVLTSLGIEVNGKSEDYGPALNPDITMLLFTSKRKKKLVQDGSDEDLFFCRGEDNFWEQAQPFKSINTDFNEGSPCLSKDGRTLYFARCSSPDGYGNCDLYMATKAFGDSNWTNVRNLGANVNSRAWDSQPALSSTEDTLYFASDRIGGFGLADIWMTYKLKDGTWAVPQNLGPVVNTRDSDVSPFLHPKYNILYFSSNGQLMNFSEIDSNNNLITTRHHTTFDIYKTRWRNGYWEEPQNIGPLVNGAGSEYYFTIDSKSKNIYYARSEKENVRNLDLYSFPLPMEGQPAAYTKLEGQLKDSVSQKPLQGIISIIDLDNGVEVAPKFLKPDGSFEFDLINNNRYMIIIQGDDFFSVEKELYLRNDTLINLVSKIIDLHKPLVLDRIEFKHGKWDILPEMHKSLDLVLKYMLDNPHYRLKIDGHTDSQGNAPDNMILSKNRAESIRSYLLEKGKIEPSRIEAEGFGNTKPLRPENSPEDRRINRRVEFDIIK